MCEVGLFDLCRARLTGCSCDKDVIKEYQEEGGVIMNTRYVRDWRMSEVSCRTLDRCAMKMNARTRDSWRSFFW